MLTVITVAGAGYLVWLGIGLLTGPAETPTAADSAEQVSWMRQAVAGLGVSGLNPKVFLLFVALLPQFVHPDAVWPVATQILALGLVHVASCVVVYSVVGTGARRVLRARPAAAAAVTRFSGIVIIVQGGAIIGEQVLA